MNDYDREALVATGITIENGVLTLPTGETLPATTSVMRELRHRVESGYGLTEWGGGSEYRPWSGYDENGEPR